ncbi:hypothetical protein N7470_003213 [Penicillium chermesinum]|nr:hypothetical protein N7470_003213 [Penicillium chermesinum]
MAQATAPPSTSEKTFTSYTKEQGEAYAKGGRTTALNSTKALSMTMRPPAASSTASLIWAAALATLSPPIQAGSIDLITAGNAAHWFKMQEFWHQAARVLKPHGSVVLWTSNPAKMHPSVPNAAAIDQALNDLGEGALKPYMAEGNVLTRDGYSSLPLPWTIDPPQPDFDEKDFVRKDWTLPEDDPNHTQVDLDKLEQIMDTMSPVTRWREAHPELRGTDQDVVKIHRNKIARLLHEAGVEPGKEVLTSIPNLAVLIVKKRGN